MKSVSPKLFIVEDDAFYSKIVSSSLQKAFPDCIIFTYRSAEEALENVHETPDFIILDHFLTGANGIDKIPEFRLALPNTRIIVSSSQHDVETFKNAYSLGANAYYKKNPLTVDNIISFITQDSEQ